MSEQPAATRASWKTVGYTGSFVSLPYRRDFSAREFVRVREGLIPEAMEDKWFVFFEDPWLFFYRSWTGRLIYRVKVDESEAGATVRVAEIVAKSETYSWTSEGYEAALLSFLVSALLLHEPAKFPVPGSTPSHDGAYQHHVVGRGAPEVSFGEGEKETKK
ncbi:MAG: hypothetical protein K0U98_05240 [Deltaproteobacteria bacterium]|nr:hypothetical protein [Deltaproteobacteria bacterium]